MHKGSIGKELECVVERAEGLKCPRCQRICGIEANFDHLCDRCCEVMIADYPDHEATPLIIESLRLQKERWRGSQAIDNES